MRYQATYWAKMSQAQHDVIQEMEAKMESMKKKLSAAEEDARVVHDLE
jgi:hypothetical protein